VSSTDDAERDGNGLFTLEQARAYYRELEKIDAAFLSSLEALEASFDTIHDFQILALNQYALVVQDRRIAGARSMASLNAHKKDLKRAQDEATAAARQARSDLGLPPGQP
jgi:hypothetical protein